MSGVFDQDLAFELRALAKFRFQQSEDLKPHAAVEARWIVEQAIAASSDGEAARATAQMMVSRRLAGEPLSRIFGEAEFYGLPIGVNHATLDPRNDTEALVDLVLTHADNSHKKLLDLGTGSGCISIALLARRPTWHGLGVDLSGDALACARANRDDPRLHQFRLVDRLNFAQSDWFSNISPDSKFDLVVSNPPYLTQTEMRNLDKSVQGFDPVLALDGGHDGLGAYRQILQSVSNWLAPGGLVGLEIGWQQRDAVVTIASENAFELVEVRQDLASRDRAVVLQEIK